jgi:hypothetical protein
MKPKDKLALEALKLYRSGEYTHPQLATRMKCSRWVMPGLLRLGKRVEERVKELEHSAYHHSDVVEWRKKAIEAKSLSDALANFRAITLAQHSMMQAINIGRKPPEDSGD